MKLSTRIFLIALWCKRSGMGIDMNVNIYYGGRGMIDDPTIFVINKIQEVLLELRVKVMRYDLHDMKSSITTLPQSLKEADAIILATTVEWYGIGGYMQEFLDACWQYGDKEKIASIYMFPVVMAKTYGEKEAELALISAWNILGGKPMTGISAYINEDAGFELGEQGIALIEHMAENVYRTVKQKVYVLPSSSAAMKSTLMKEALQLTPQETEQLSKFVADDNFVAKQKKDIEELSGMFKEMLGDQQRGGDEYYINSFMQNFAGRKGFSATYVLVLSDKKKNIKISISDKTIDVRMVRDEDAEVVGKLTQAIFDDIVYGRMTFQRAFMSGAMTAKGNFTTLRMLDEVFHFG